MKNRYLIFDTETTGLTTEDKIIDIAFLEIIDNKITGNSFQSYINPEMIIPEESINIHKITNEQVADKPKFAALANQIITFIDNSNYKNILVAHNINFDLKFLSKEFKACGFNWNEIKNKFDIIDTLQIAKRKFPKKKVNLDHLCQYYNISTEDRLKFGHGALLDSNLLAQIFIFFLQDQDYNTLLNGRKIFFGIQKNTDILTNENIYYKITNEELENHMNILSYLNSSLKW